MKSVREILDLSTSHFEANGIPQARRQAEEILSLALQVPRLDLYLDTQRPLQEMELEKCREVLRRRLKREPIQYIAGEVEFFGCRLQVDERVLIPRPETELLADKVARALEREELEGKTLLDLCCGSGCLSISLKKRFPSLNVVASDLSVEALQMARQNAEANDVQVTFLQGDFLQPFEGQKADYVLCNPPYIKEEDWTKLEPEVCVFEPQMALLGGEDGLQFYRRLAEGLPAVIHPAAKLWLELGAGQGNEVKEIFATAVGLVGEVDLDWSGHDRFFFLEFL